MISKAKIKLIQSLRQKKNRIKKGLFVAEGTKTVNDLLGAGIKTAEIYGTSNITGQIKVLNKTSLCEVSDIEMKKISFLSNASDVLGLFEIPQINIDDVFYSDFIIALDGVQDPGNLGTIVRLADWFGVKNIVCSLDCADLYNPKTVQSTMGSIARVQVHFTDLPEFLLKAKSEKKYKIYGSFMKGEPIYEISFQQKKILVMGSEGQGIFMEVEQLIDEHITIPAFFDGKDGPESLNVAMATGIIVSEMKRK